MKVEIYQIVCLYYFFILYSYNLQQKKSNQKHIDEENKVDWRKASPNTEPNGTR